VEKARQVVGTEKLVGVSTHNLEQFRRAAASSADYIAVGPIFSTGTKSNPDPVVGTEFIREVRLLTDKPIVAIGGITLERAPEIIESGADSVAVISDILGAPEPGSAPGNTSTCWDPPTTRRQAEGIRRMVDTTHPLADTSAKSGPRFVRAIGLFDGTMIVVGSMIGSGIFIVAADIRGKPDPPAACCSPGF